MFSILRVFSAGSMPEPVMDMEQVTAVIKAVDLTAAFGIRKFGTVVSVSQCKCISRCSPAILCNAFYPVWGSSIISIFQLVAVCVYHRA